MDIVAGLILSLALYGIGLIVLFYIIKSAVYSATIQAYQEMGLVKRKSVFEPTNDDE